MKGNKKRDQSEQEDKRAEDQALFEAYLNRVKPLNKDASQIQKMQDRVAPIQKSDLKKINYDATLDLHGKTVREAGTILPAFLLESISSNRNVVLIIHGKGLHSEGRGVVKKFVEDYIKHSGSVYIRQAKRAPDDMGGSGATVLWLKASSKVPR